MKLERIVHASIRGKMWVYRIVLTLLTGSIPLLRRVSGQGSSKLQIPMFMSRQTFSAEGIPCEWLTPRTSSNTSAILYLHSGGGVVGLLDSERSMVAHLSMKCHARVLLPDYRLAPENPFPAGLEDCLTIYKWMIKNGFPPKRIAVAGSSAGGLLTISLLLAVKESNLPLPATAVCISPNTDPSCGSESIRTNRYRDALLSTKYLRTMMKLYSGSHDLNDPLLTPLNANLAGLPPMLIQVGGDELLLDDSIHFSNCARNAGVDLTLEIWPHMWHVWHVCIPDLPEADQAIEHISQYILAAFDKNSPGESKED